MIHGVHFCSAYFSVRKYGIPALPNRSCSHQHFIEPTGIALLEQKVIRHVVHSIVRQDPAQIRSSDKTGLEMIAVTAQFIHEPFSGLFKCKIRRKSHVQHHHICCHCIYAKAPRCSEILFHESIMYLIGKLSVFGLILFISDDACCLCHDVR